MALRLVHAPTPPSAPRPEADAATITAAAKGDEAACRAFVTCYQDRVFTLALRLVGGDRAAAEDCAQEAFARAFRALPSFDPRGPARPSTWLCTIATRVCLDERRRHRRRPVELSAHAGVDRADPRDAHAQAHAHALATRVERALAALPLEQRAVFVLRVLGEHSEHETAAALDVDVGTVKSRLSRARAALRLALAEVLHG